MAVENKTQSGKFKAQSAKLQRKAKSIKLPSEKIAKGKSKKEGIKKKTVAKKSVTKKTSATKKKVSPKNSSKEVAKKIKPKRKKQSILVKAEKRAVSKKSFDIHQKTKPKVAIISLTSCEGCQFVLLDLGQKFLDFATSVELVDFRLIEDMEDPGGELDLVLIEGNPTTKENEKTLLEARKRAKILAALGNCAAMGGIPEIRNYQEGQNTIKHVYKYIQGIDNPPIREIDNLVRVDFVFPGCPITGEEFLKYIPELLAGRIPIIADSPVCVECRKKGNKCLLLEGKPCFGPMILGGCDAICPSSRMGCQGCRGLRPTGNVKAMKATLKKIMTDEEFENTTEIYGLRDDIEDKERRQRIV